MLRAVMGQIHITEGLQGNLGENLKPAMHLPWCETRSVSWFQCPCHPAMPVASSLSSASPQLMGVIVPRVTTFDRRMITQGTDTSSFCVRRPMWLEPKETKDKRGDK